MIGGLDQYSGRFGASELGERSGSDRLDLIGQRIDIAVILGDDLSGAFSFGTGGIIIDVRSANRAAVLCTGSVRMDR